MAGCLLIVCASFLCAEETGDDDSPVLEAEGITIVAPVPADNRSVQTLNREEISRIPAHDVAGILEQAFGLSVTRTASGANVNLRGLGAGRVAVYVDGVNIASSLSGDSDLSTLDLSAIEAIELIEGGSGSSVSGAMGGVIAISTVKKHQPGGSFSVTVSNTASLPGSFTGKDGNPEKPHDEDLLDGQQIRLNAGLGGKGFSLGAHLSAGRTGNHFLYEDYTGQTRRSDHGETAEFGAGVSLIQDLPDYATLKLTTDFFTGTRNVPAYMGGGAYKNILSQNSVKLDLPRAFRDDMAGGAQFSYVWNRFEYEDNSTLVHESTTISLDGRLDWFVNQKLTAHGAFSYRFSGIDSTNVGTQSGQDGGFSLSGNYAISEKMILFPELTLLFRDREFIPVPKVGIVWQLSDSISIKNNYYRVFRFPAFEDLYWDEAGLFGNPDLKSEDGWGGDLSFLYTKSVFQVDLSLFATGIRDAILWNNAGGSWQPDNVGAAALFGGSARIRGKIPVQWENVESLTAALSYEYLLSYLLSGSFQFSDSLRMPYMPAHTAGFSLEISGPKFSFTVTGHYESTRFTETTNTIRLAPFFILNLGYTQTIHSNFSVFARINNLLNTRYFSQYDSPQTGFTLTIGAKLRLSSVL
ncbi:hypothetical protein FACS1894172_05410 [Spirochaetia bacterium]|nr:hypothetical protein FACS1894172_05410 [Spirochaetia bacterium]